MAPNSSNTYRKARALLMKTVANDCTAPEHVAATNLASTIITRHNLDPARVEWPAPPRGWQWQGTPGRGGTIIETPAKAKAKPTRTPQSAAGDKPKRITQGDLIIAMLRRPEGVTIDQLMAEFDILRQSARSLVSVWGRKAGGTTLDRATGVYHAA